jgi:alpha-1,3-mannosyltransferase
VFDLQWSVNWAFLIEAVFQSPQLALVLLGLHLLVLFLFLSYRWGGLLPLLRGRIAPFSPAQRIRILLESQLIGVVCARTLHYQFYSWYSSLLCSSLLFIC